MALVVLDSVNYNTANTYVEDITVDEETHFLAVQRLESEFRFYGSRLYPSTQTLAFPRTKLYYKGRITAQGELFPVLAEAQFLIIQAINLGTYGSLGTKEDYDFTAGPIQMTKSSSKSQTGTLVEGLDESGSAKDYLSILLKELGTRVDPAQMGQKELP